jgi:Protein of unknown function (DUF2782)
MKRKLSLPIALLLTCASLSAFAAEPRDKAPPPGMTDAPPPALDDPGVKTAPIAAEPDKATAASANAGNTNADSMVPPPPDVGIRKQGDDTIEEYRSSGKVSMIRITGKSGITQTYIDSDGDGRLEGNPKDGPIAPVYYKLYEWN